MDTRIRGAFAPVPTPIGGHGRFDPQALDRHLRWIEEKGLDGALILGTNGEFPSFSYDDRCRVAEAAASSERDLQLLLGVGSCAVGEVEGMVDLAADLGFEAVLCPPPFYFRGAPVEGVAAFFRRVLERSTVPVLLYHIPQVTGVSIGDELLTAIGRHRRLEGVKDSSGDPEEMDRLLGHFGSRSYLVGSDHLVTRCLASGGTGSISAAANVVPGLVAAVGQDPDRQGELNSVRSLLEDFGLGPAAKAILRHRGFGHYGSQPPLTGLDDAQRKILIARFGELTGSDLTE